MKRLVILTVLMLAGCSLGNNEEGTHRGVVTDISRGGLICKTWDGELISGSGGASIKYRFTITNQETVDFLREAQKSGKEVIFDYSSPIVFSLCSSKHGIYVHRAAYPVQ